MATSFKIRGIEPPDLASYPVDVRKTFWGWVVELGIRQKGKEILAGLDKDGKPLRAILPKTRKNRKSEMTPSGNGDPNAPALIPGWQKSRTYSLLAGRALTTHADFYWRYDAWTGDSWGQVLAYQAKKGRDVIGISPKGLATVRVQAWAKWTQWKAGTLKEAKKKAAVAVGIPQVGNYDTTHATFGIGVSSAKKFNRGTWTGGMTRDEWDAYLRGSAVAALPGRPARPAARSPISGPNYNRLLLHTWGQGPRPGSTGSAVPGTPRPGPRKPPAATPSPTPRWAPENRISGFFNRPKPRPASINPDLPEYKRHAQDVLQAQTEQLEQLAASVGLSPDAYRSRVTHEFRQVVADADMYIRIRPNQFLSVLGDGRFKSQFETGTSGGILDAETRRRVEARVLGLKPNTSAPERPIYGYFSGADFKDFETPHEVVVKGYGHISVKLKPGVRKRASATGGDSLVRVGILQGRMAADADSTSAGIGDYNWKKVHDAIFNRGLTGEALRREMIHQLQYIEAQFHGRLGIEDIAEVAFRSEPPAPLREALDAKGIKWRVKS